LLSPQWQQQQAQLYHYLYLVYYYLTPNNSNNNSHDTIMMNVATRRVLRIATKKGAEHGKLFSSQVSLTEEYPG
jgi:hypothetical protein